MKSKNTPPAGPAEGLPQFDDAKQQLAANGYEPIPLHWGAKRPAVSGWADASIDELLAHQRPHDGIGLRCGPLVVVDIDVYDQQLVDDLVSAAHRRLGATPLVRTGRAPKTALFYRTKSPRPKRTSQSFQTADLVCDQRVEILGNGQQVVAFNLHPDTGRPYVWAAATPLDTPLRNLPEIDDAKVTAFLHDVDAILAAAPGYVAVQGVGERRQAGSEVVHLRADQKRPPGERRPDFDDAVESGHLRAMLSYLNSDDRKVWIDVGIILYHASGRAPDGLEVWDRWSSKSSLYEDGEDGTPAEKWDGFGKVERIKKLGWGTLIHMARQAGWDGTTRCQDDLLPAPIVAPAAAFATTPLPEPFPGVVADLTEWVLENSHRPQPAFALVSALASIAASCGNVYAWPDGLRMNSYWLIVGPSGSGKDAPQRCARTALGKGSRVNIIDMPASGEGLQDRLALTSELLIIGDEVAQDFIAMNARGAGGHQTSKMKEFLRLYTAATTSYPLRVKANDKTVRPSIENPAVSLLGATTPEKLALALTAGDVASGLLGRFTVVEVRERVPRQRFDAPMEMPDRARAALDSLNRGARKFDVGGGIAGTVVLTIADDAKTCLDEIEDRFDAEANAARTDHAVELLVRSAERVKKVAGAIACAENPDAPTVTVVMLKWAEDLIRATNAQTLDLAADRIAVDEHDAAAKAVLRVIGLVVGGKVNLRSAQARKLAKKGYAVHGEVLKVSKLPLPRFDLAVAHLRATGQVERARADLVADLGVTLAPGRVPDLLWLPKEAG